MGQASCQTSKDNASFLNGDLQELIVTPFPPLVKIFQALRFCDVIGSIYLNFQTVKS